METIMRSVRFITSLSLSLIITFALAACGGGGSAKDGGLSGKLVITGSSTCAPVISEAGKRFEKLHPGVRIDVQTGGSGRGIGDVNKGAADIGMASRALKDAEKSLAAHPFASDGVCIILHKDNPVTELTSEQVVAIYTGKTTNWKDVGGKDATITVVNKAEGRATLEVFLEFFKLKNPDIKAAVIVGENEHAIKTIVGDVNAIGYVSIGTAEYSAGSGTAIKLLPAGGVPATTKALADGKFPISRPLILVTKPDMNPLTKAFIDYCQSKEIHDIIASQYFVPASR